MRWLAILSCLHFFATRGFAQGDRPSPVPGNDIRHAEYLVDRAESLIAQGRFREAREARDKALALLAKAPATYHWPTASLLASGLRLQCLPGRVSAEEARYAELIRDQYRGVSDAELCDKFRKIPPDEYVPKPFDRPINAYQSLLVEMQQRKGAVIENCLKDNAGWLEKVTRKRHPDVQNVEVLTALRRVQGKSDPVTIEIDGPDRLVSYFPDAPDLAVRLVNRDCDGHPVGMQFGGDTRSGRQARWYIQVHDSRGRLVHGAPRPSGEGGGLSFYGPLEAGKSWETVLEGRNFIATPEPGEYLLQVYITTTNALPTSAASRTSLSRVASRAARRLYNSTCARRKSP